MTEKQKFINLAKQGHPECPENFVYIGKGDEKRELEKVFGVRVSSFMDEDVLDTNCGVCTKHYDYFIEKSKWEKTFGPLPKIIKKQTQKQEITLSQIKKEYEAAKKLIGKTINPDGLKKVVSDAILLLTEVDSRYNSYAVMEFFKKNGYVIALNFKNDISVLPFENNKEIPEIIAVSNIRGEVYTAEQKEETWKFGCAEISKALITDVNVLMDATYCGNRKLTSVQIGDGIFDRETIKILYDAQE